MEANMSPMLSEVLVQDVLVYLGCSPKGPTLRALNRLIEAYIRKVPWESVSRIVKRHVTSETNDCPRWPEEFWHDAMRDGFGGTCFESNLAFYSLLMALGYEGYLTVNDMGTSRACHAATVLLLGGKKYLVDITIPLHSAIRLDPHRITRRRTSFHDYTIRPIRGNRFVVERSHHPKKDAFTLIDVPVNFQDYQTILENDYKETGLFLKSVVMVKVIDRKTWRFFSDHQPYRLESFNRSGKREIFVGFEILPYLLAGLFKMPEEKISAALTWVQALPAAYEPVPELLLDGIFSQKEMYTG